MSKRAQKKEIISPNISDGLLTNSSEKKPEVITNSKVSPMKPEKLYPGKIDQSNSPKTLKAVHKGGKKEGNTSETEKTITVDSLKTEMNAINEKANITNTDIVFAILEVTKNPAKYNIDFSTKSSKFWEIVCTQYSNVFKEFKPETLRKYWRTLGTAKDVNSLATILSDYKNCFETNTVK